MTKYQPMNINQLKKMSQRELDDLFRKASSGPIPEGKGNGTAIVYPGTKLTNIIADIVRLKFWKGKVFERDKTDPNKGTLKNRILLTGHEAIEAKVYKENSWLDGKECIVLDYSETSLVAHWIRDEIRQIEPGLYLGKVYWDKKRLIDFALKF
jgi:hypothetical protein